MQRPGKCCEECLPSRGNCLYDGTPRYHGEMWNSTHCDFCVCDEGQVTCQVAECAKVECAKVRKAFLFQDGSLKSCDFFPLLSQLTFWGLFSAIYLENASQGRRGNFVFSLQV